MRMKTVMSECVVWGSNLADITVPVYTFVFL